MSPVLVSICTEIKPGEKGFEKPLGNLGCLKMSARKRPEIHPWYTSFPCRETFLHVKAHVENYSIS